MGQNWGQGQLYDGAIRVVTQELRACCTVLLVLISEFTVTLSLKLWTLRQWGMHVSRDDMCNGQAHHSSLLPITLAMPHEHRILVDPPNIWSLIILKASTMWTYNLNEVFSIVFQSAASLLCLPRVCWVSLNFHRTWVHYNSAPMFPINTSTNTSRWLVALRVHVFHLNHNLPDAERRQRLSKKKKPSRNPTMSFSQCCSLVLAKHLCLKYWHRKKGYDRASQGSFLCSPSLLLSKLRGEC